MAREGHLAVMGNSLALPTVADKPAERPGAGSF